MYPQGILDISHQIIIENFPDVILDNCPNELLERYPYELLRTHPQEILSSDEFKLHFKRKLPNELILNDGKKFLPDVPLETLEDLIINIEFQAYPIGYKGEARFNVYQAILHLQHQKHVLTIVFSTLHHEHELITHKINQIDGFTMLIVSLKALNQKQTLYNSNYKIRNNICMSDSEKALLLLCPLMDEETRINALLETIDLAPKIRNLSQDEYRDILKIQSNFAQHWFKREKIEKTGGNDMVVLTEEAKKHLDSLLSDEEKEKYKEEGKLEGIEEGRLEGSEERSEWIALQLFDEGFSLDLISRVTGLSELRLNQLYNSK